MLIITKKNKYILKKLTSILFYLTILLFFISFNFQDSKNGGWVQQFITAPIGSAQLYGIDFKDSLTGYAIANVIGTSDTSYVLKTTNGGINWNIILNIFNARMYDFKVLNKDTLFVGAYWNIYKSSNGGLNWSVVNIQGGFVYGLYVLNTDTMWYACPTPGLYRTTNGGLNWQQQYYYISGVNGYPESIYMYNRNIGFMGTDHGELLKTTNSGLNWNNVYSSNNWDILDFGFKDSLTCFMANGGLKKTTNGGLNWQSVTIPTIPGVYFTVRDVNRISIKNDTAYIAGSWIEFFPPTYKVRGIIFKSTNGGANWGYQLPDTSWGLGSFQFISFLDSKTGWVYNNAGQGLHTKVGGDSTIILSIKRKNISFSQDFNLYQNYPNPFNSMSNVKFQMLKQGFAEIKLFDIIGKEIKTIINKRLSSGIYEVKLNGNSLSSGIYLYSLFIDGVKIDTKKMLMIK